MFFLVRNIIIFITILINVNLRLVTNFNLDNNGCLTEHSHPYARAGVDAIEYYRGISGTEDFFEEWAEKLLCPRAIQVLAIAASFPRRGPCFA